MTKQSIFAKVTLHGSNCYGFWHGVWVIPHLSLPLPTQVQDFTILSRLWKKNLNVKCLLFNLYIYIYFLMPLLLLLLLSRFSRVRLCDPIDGSSPGSPIPGILQARTPEWVAISFSNVRKWKVKVKSLSRIQLLVTPWTAAYQAPLSTGFSRQKYWNGVPLPSPFNAFRYREK